MAMQARYSPDTDYEEKIHPTIRTDTQLQARQLQPAFGGDLNPGLHQNVPAQKKFANPAPLGLSAFALTTFVLSCINIKANDVTAPNLVVALAFGYGGLIQLLAGMWEMAVGNTFGATALSSYGGFWISFAIILTPAFDIPGSYTGGTTGTGTFGEVFALFLWGWFIFTTILLLLTLRSTVMFFLLFLTLDLAFLFLALGYQLTGDIAATMTVCGGSFGIAAAALAWYNAFAGIADDSNFFFKIPVIHFPWSKTAMDARKARMD